MPQQKINNINKINIDTQPIADAIKELKTSKQEVVVEKLPPIIINTRPHWTDYASVASVAANVIMAFAAIKIWDKIRNRENVKGTFEAKSGARKDILYADLHIENRGGDFVWLEFTKGQHDPRGTYSDNQIFNPVYIMTKNGQSVLKKFVYMKDAGCYHREIGIPPRCPIDICIEASDGKTLNPDDVKIIKLITTKGNAFALKRKK